MVTSFKRSVWVLLFSVGLLMNGSCDDGFSREMHPPERVSLDGVMPCIKKAIRDYHADNQLDSLLLSRLIVEYSGRNNLIWSDSGVVTSMSGRVSQVLSNAFLSGLLPWEYPVPYRYGSLEASDHEPKVSCEKWAKDDVVLSMSLLRYMVHLKIGVQRSIVLDSTDVHLIDSLIIPRFPLKDSLSLSALADLEPVSPFYHQMKSVMPDFSLLFDHFILGGLESTHQRSWSFGKILNLSGFCMHTLPFTEGDFQLGLHSWQRENHLPVDDQLTYDTRKALSDLGMSVFFKVSLNMDRIRQYPPLLHNYLWVNIPEFRLYACAADSIKQTWKVIVGKPKTPTPVLTSTMSHVLTYPQWNIPPSIVVGEILPDMRRDPFYLQKRGYVITDWKGALLDPSQVSVYSYTLNNHPYNIMQPPGNDNALGILKFLFDNDNTVYLHDTNSRNLFAKNHRALSHGCVRVNEPHRLAEYLLDQASLSVMDHQLSAKRSGYIKVKQQVGICIRYITCSTDSDGNLILLPDLYHLDDIGIQEFCSGKPVDAVQ